MNALLKGIWKLAFSDWHVGEVCSTIARAKENGEVKDEAVAKAVESLRPDLRLSVLKLLHARWMINAFVNVASDPEQIQRGWKASGITQPLIDFTTLRLVWMQKSTFSRSATVKPSHG